MSIARKISAGLLSLAILGTATGCMPSPFEQDIPSTQWTTDKDGNRVKVSSSESKELSTPQQIQATAADYYKSLYSKKTAAQLKAFNEKAAPVNPSDEKAKEKLLAEFKGDFYPVQYFYQGDMNDNDFMTMVVGTAFVVTMLGGSSDVKIEVPLSAIRVTADTATVESTEIDTWVNGKKSEKSVPGEDGATKLDMVYRDGKWLIDAKKMADKTTLKR